MKKESFFSAIFFGFKNRSKNHDEAKICKICALFANVRTAHLLHAKNHCSKEVCAKKRVAYY